MAHFDAAWSVPERRFKWIPGKEFISIFSMELQARYRASLSLAQLTSEMHRNEVPQDLVEIISNISRFFSEEQPF
jgi:hypothetical protein